MNSKSAPIILSIFFDSQCFFYYDGRESNSTSGVMRDPFEYNEL